MRQKLARAIGTLGLVFVLYFSTSGGPYTTETLIHSVGPGLGLLILALVPLVWSVPEALIMGELASMLPEEGGIIVGSIVRSGASGLFKTAGSHGCIRWWTWRSTRCCSINIFATSSPDWTREWNGLSRLPLFGGQHGSMSAGR